MRRRNFLKLLAVSPVAPSVLYAKEKIWQEKDFVIKKSDGKTSMTYASDRIRRLTDKEYIKGMSSEFQKSV